MYVFDFIFIFFLQSHTHTHTPSEHLSVPPVQRSFLLASERTQRCRGDWANEEEVC